MKLYIELSGYGRYRICTMFPSTELEKVIKDSEQYQKRVFSDEKNWEFPFSTDISWAFGMDRALRAVQSYSEIFDEDYIKLLWSPSKLRESFRTHALLSRIFGEPSHTESVEGDRLAVFIARHGNGWNVKADFGSDIWDVVESPGCVGRVLSTDSLEVGLWYEDESNSPYTKSGIPIIFDGKDGKTLQINSPWGDGLWIAGARNSDSSHQLCEHNTDSYLQAFAHVISLACLQKACRDYIACKPQ